MDIVKALNTVQTKMVVPKNQYNSFGKYKYRNCEDILSAAKVVLPSESVIMLTDEIVLIGDRYYIKATATLRLGAECLSCVGFARESDQKKGMDSSQLTGSTSSYARKYALCGLLMIDDERDADKTSTHGQVKNGTGAKLDTKPTQPGAPYKGKVDSLIKYIEGHSDKAKAMAEVEKKYFPKLNGADRATIINSYRKMEQSKTRTSKAKTDKTEPVKQPVKEKEIPW